MKKITLLSFLILVSISPTLNTLAQDGVSTPTMLTLEVTFYPGRKPAYQTVPGPNAKPSGSWFGLFARTKSLQLPAGASAVEAVRVVSRIEAGGVRVIVSTLSGTKALENEQEVGTYLIHETEKITIEELRRFGIEPFEIRLLRVNPSIAPVPPVILKGVDSVIVLNAMPKETTLPSFRIILRNQSNKNIIGLGVDVVAEGRVQLSSRPRGIEGQPLIPACKEYWLTVAAPNRAKPASGGYEPTVPSGMEIQIKAAIFDDGTYEGDAETAIAARGNRAGEKMELPRVISLLASALNSSSTNVIERLRDLESRVSSVGSDADPQMLQTLTSEFPGAGNSVSSTIKQGMEFSATTIKSNLLKEIHQLQNEDPQTLTADFYRMWLSKTKERYEKWLARL
jgi:hypothetical protein